MNNTSSRKKEYHPVKPGNLPLGVRYRVPNPDGSISTVRTMSVGTDEGEFLIPTIVNNQLLSDDAAIDHFFNTGENFGLFDSIEAADDFANRLHLSHENFLKTEQKKKEEKNLR